jgi:nitrogen regulatory protein P-II 1
MRHAALRSSSVRRENKVKKIETLISLSKLDKVKEALEHTRVKRITFSKVRDYGRHSSHLGNSQGIEYLMDFLPMIKIELVVEDDKVKEVVDTIIVALIKNGRLEDGEIHVLPMDAVLHIRDGVH